MHFQAAVPFLLLPAIAAAALPDAAAQARQVYQFPDTTFIENIAVRPNGQLLLDTFSNGSLYNLDPTVPSPEPELVARMPEVGALIGITEIGDDVFAIAGGILRPGGFGFLRGSLRIFVIDMKDRKVVTAALVPDTEAINGIVSLPWKPHVVLGADSIGGRIFRIDTRTGCVQVVITDELLGPSDDPANVPLGVNGIEIRSEYLYFTNSALGFFGRLKITKEGKKAGEIEKIATIENPGFSHAYDDFALDREGNAYVTLHINSLVKIALDGTQTLVVGGGDSEIFKAPTSVALSRDGRSVYVTTGGIGINGEQSGGQVVEVQIS